MINQYTREIAKIDNKILVNQFISGLQDRNEILKQFQDGQIEDDLSQSVFDFPVRPEYEAQFLDKIDNDTGEESWIFRTISNQSPFSTVDSTRIASFLEIFRM